MATKYSRQREEIKHYLSTRKDHPTADDVYEAIRKEIPNISLGTVYRNLNMLADTGDILRLRVGDGVDHFDYNTSAHYHFICRECNGVSDLPTLNLDSVLDTAGRNFDGQIDGHVTYFYGTCGICCHKQQDNH